MDTWKLRFCGIFILLISVICSTFGLQVSIPQSIYEVARGDEVIITCSFQPKNPVNRLIVITWTGEPDGSFDDEGISFGTFYSDDSHVDINAMYEGKAQIEGDVNGKVSKLLLKHVTLRESRRIKCLVQIPGDTEGQTSDSTSLVVLVAPSDPVCKIKGTKEYGQNISLTCVSEEGSPAPTYNWQSYDVKNNPRQLPPKATDKDGVLSLFNVSMDTSGYYICTSANKIRSATCNLTLAVMPSTIKIGATAGIIGGCVAGVAVLVLIIYCCCKGKHQPEEFAMEPPVIEYHDSPDQETKEDGYGDGRKASFEGHIDQRERDGRKASFEGHIDQRERYEMKAEQDSDRNSNRRLDYDDQQEDQHPERYDDRRDIYRRGRNEDRKERYDDHKDQQYDDRQQHYDGRRDHFSDRQDRYDDPRDRCDNRQNRFDDQRDHYDNRQEHYRDHRERYDNLHEGHDDGRGYYRQNRYDDRNSFDDRRDDYNDRQDRYDHQRYRYDDRQDHYHDHRDRYDQYSDRQDR